MNEPSTRPPAISDRARIAPSAISGPGCLLKGDISIGPRAQLGAGVSLNGNVVIGEGCRIDAGVKTTGDLKASLVIGKGAHVGAGSTLSLGIKGGRRLACRSGFNRDRKYPSLRDRKGKSRIGGRLFDNRTASCLRRSRRRKRRSKRFRSQRQIISFPEIFDPQGITFGEAMLDIIPYVPKRYFMVFGVPPMQLRGEHAHATSEEILICIAGSIAVVVDDGDLARGIHLR